MEKLQKCDKCKTLFPNVLIKPFVALVDVTSYEFDVCPICALNMLKHIHGDKYFKFRTLENNAALNKAKEYLGEMANGG